MRRGHPISGSEETDNLPNARLLAPDTQDPAQTNEIAQPARERGAGLTVAVIKAAIAANYSIHHGPDGFDLKPPPPTPPQNHWQVPAFLGCLFLPVALFSILLIAGGIWLTYLKTTGKNEISLLGQTLNTTSNGVASFFIGAVILFFTARKAMSVFRDMHK